ncbi:SDR family NAD(P)-dependent oxidoreductase [Streptomyces sp. NPDC059215]|uniref:SDR family NAD(P)-dependent oxidoreductase n=1 Tax=Streptomyces sp. NPDC059215 TaxID=3346772 RepID=UPI003695BF44
MEFENRVALVTGVGEEGNLGYEIAKILASNGADVIISSRNQESGDKLAATLDPTGKRVTFIGADLRNPNSVRQLASRAGTVNILVNNAAAIAAGPTEELSLSGFDDMFAVNVRAPHVLTAALLPGMIASGQGQIINISSIGAKLGTAGRAAYASSKAALESLTRSWAVEFAPHGIRVNAVAPGPMHGPKLLRNASQAVIAEIGKSVPLGRTVEPREVAEAVLYLASDRASYATGAVLALDGGRTVI